MPATSHAWAFVLAGTCWACGARSVSARAGDGGGESDASSRGLDAGTDARADADDALPVVVEDDFLSAQEATCQDRPPLGAPAACPAEGDELLGAATGGFVALDGRGTAVALRGERVYVTFTDRRFAVFDISDATAPVLRGVVDLPGEPADVGLGGRWAWVAAGNAGLVGVDVMNGAQPRFEVRVDVGGDARALETTCAFVYVAAGPAGLAVVDIQTPEAPSLVASVPLDSDALAVSVAAGRALVGTGTGVELLDVTAPEAPFVRSSLETDGAVRAVAWTSTWAYLGVDGPSPGVVPVDFSSLEVPVAGSLMPEPAAIVGIEADTTVLAWTVADPEYYLSVARWCDPEAPRGILGAGFGQCGPGCDPPSGQAMDHALEDRRLVVLHSLHGLQVLDLCCY